jgi:hypothetical protein
MLNSSLRRWLPPALLMIVLGAVIWLTPTPEQPVSGALKSVTEQPQAAVKVQPKTSFILERKKERLSELDQRERKIDMVKVTAERHKALAALRIEVPGVQVDFDPLTGAPSHIMAAGRFLAKAPPGLQNAHASVREFVRRHEALFGHGAAALDPGQARVTREDVTAHNGMRTVVWQQEVAGVPVFQTILKANLTKDGDLITLGSHFMPDAEAAAGALTKLVPNPPLNAPKALEEAAASLGGTLDLTKVTPKAAPQGTEQAQKLNAPGFTDTTAHLSWVPMDEDTLRLAWEIETFSLQQNEMFRLLIDAEDGKILVRQSLTADISNASYRVFTGDSPTPMTPGHNTPLSTQPAEVARSLVTMQALNTTASPEGWIPDGQNETLGNNVDAHLDLNADNIADTPRPQGSPSRVFDFSFNSASEPTAYRDATVTQLFYFNNWVHDRMYDLGFTESAGNFQTNNFGRGGNGNDAVQADAQDGSGTNNANFSTPSDGSPGRMQMYIWPGPTPDRDSSFDGDIVVHEYGHGISNRLVGGGVGISAWQSRGMGEGWSDFYAMSLQSEATDNVNGVYPMAGYSTYLLSGMTTNYYHGLRRYPYCTDMTKAPLTYKDIDPTQASPHTGISLSPRYGSSNGDPSQYHAQGEVWCNMLMECRANIITHHGWAVGNELMLRIVTDGLKLTPANPTFIQARDAIIQADLVNNGGANRNRLWAGFAKRGMGANATGPANSTTTGVVESYDLPDDLSVTPTAVFAATGNSGGPFAPGANAYTLSNTGTSSLNWTASSSQGWLTLSSTSGTLAPGANTTVTATINATANTLPDGLHNATLTFLNTSSSSSIIRQASLRVGVVDYFTEVFDTSTQDIDNQSFMFTPGAGASGYTVLRNPVTVYPTDPTGGTSLTMSDDTYAAVTLTGGAQVAIFGTMYSTFYVGSNGYITFGTGDSSYSESAANHFSLPRVAALYDDLLPTTGQVTWRQLADRVAVTWQSVSQYSGSDSNNFQIELFFDGRIRISHLAVAATDGLIGLSRGSGLPADFTESDFSAYPSSILSLNFAAAATEGSGAISGTVSVPAALANALTVSLASSNSGEVTVPATVEIAAGQTSATFNLSIVDDALLDGSQNAQITATAAGYALATRFITVNDNELSSFTLTAPTTAAEGAAGIPCTVSMPAAPVGNIVVNLTSSDVTALTVPATVTIPAGQTSVSFNAAAPDNTLSQGPRNTTITASIPSWTAGAAVIEVGDNDTPTLALTGPTTVGEGSGIQTYTATVNTPLAANLSIALTSSDTNVITMPATVTILAGNLSATFPATVVDDAVIETTQSAILGATAAGYPAGTLTVTVQDDEAHHFTFASIASPQKRNRAFPVLVTARTAGDEVVTAFNSTVALSSSGGAIFSPTSLNFSNGVAALSMTVTASASGLVLSATSGGATGSSNAFDVQADTMAGFTWTVPSTTQSRDTAFSVSVQAVDDLAQPVTGYTDATQLELWSGFSDRNTGTLNTSNVSTKIYNTAFQESRSTLLYTSAELGTGPKWLGGWFFSQGTAGSLSMTSFTIRIKPTLLTNLNGAAWDNTGWTTVNTGTSSATATFFTFSKPYYWDGVSNLLVDVSFDNSTSGTAGQTHFTPTTAVTVMSGTSNGTHGAPTSWTQASGPAPQYSTELPYLSLYEVRKLGPLPQSPVTFVAGAYSGTASSPVSTSPGPYLLARSPAGVEGFSNRLLISATGPTAPAGTDTLFSDGFETGTFGASWSTAGGSGATGRLQVTPANTPRAGFFHATMDTTSLATGTFARNQLTLTQNLTGRRNVSVEFYPKEFSDDNHGGFGGIFDAAQNFDGLAISPDGVNWVEVSSMISLGSTYGTLTRIPLDPFIQRYGWAYNSTFRLKWVQYDDQAISNDGIAIDDVAVRADAATSIALSLPATLTEGATGISVTATLPSAVVSNTVVTLTSSAPTRLAVPASVTVLAGSSTANFTVSAPQDGLLDYGKNAYITASASGQTTSYTHTFIADDEIGVITLTMPAGGVTEGVSGTGTIAITPIPTVNVPVKFSSSNTAQATVSTFITYTAGSASRTFTISPVNDTLLDGTQSVDITATVAGWTPVTAAVNVHDNEVRTLALNIPTPTLSEGSAPVVGTVTITGLMAADFVVSLASANTGDVTVPASVTIPAGQTSAAFNITPVDDGSDDGPQTVVITASAATFTDGTASVTVLDNDASYFDLTAIPSPQSRNGLIPVTITARDRNGARQLEFYGTATLSASAGGSAVSMTPGVTGAFDKGVWTGVVSITQPAIGVVVTASTLGGATGASNPFDVQVLPATKIGFDPVPQPLGADEPFNMRVFAADASGARVNESSGPVSVEAVATLAGTPTGFGQSDSVEPFAAAARSRVQMLVPASEVGSAQTLRWLGLRVKNVLAGSQDYENVTLRLQHTTETVLPSTWISTGWTQVAQGPLSLTVGDVNIPFTQSFNYNGTDNLLVDISFDNTTLPGGAVLDGTVKAAACVLAGTSGTEPPLGWTGTTPAPTTSMALPNITFGREGPVLRTLALTLADGQATSPLALPGPLYFAFLRGVSGSLSGEGALFVVGPATMLEAEHPQVVFSDGFESGAFRPEWAITGTVNHRTQVTSANGPQAGIFHMTMDAHTNANSRNEATLTLDLANKANVLLKFWMKENSDEDQAPPSNPYTGGADYDGVAISADGNTWYEVQPLRGTASNNTYQLFTVSLDNAIAAAGLSYNSSFKIRFNHYDNSPWVSGDGFAFDNVEVTAQPGVSLTLNTPMTLAEGSTVSGTVTLSAARGTDTVVTLARNHSARLTVPANVTIPAGSTSASFDLTAVEDTYLNGSVQAVIRAQAAGLAREAFADVTVTDNDTPAAFTLTLPASVSEGGTATATLSLGQPALGSLVVALSSNITGLLLPTTVEIPIGSSSATFTVQYLQNFSIRDPATATITATLGAVADSESITLIDDDALVPLVITLPATVTESAAAVSGTVGFQAPATREPTSW